MQFYAEERLSTGCRRLCIALGRVGAISGSGCAAASCQRQYSCLYSDQVKLGRNAPSEEGGEETVSMANLELLQELNATALDGGDWSAAILKVIESWCAMPLQVVTDFCS